MTWIIQMLDSFAETTLLSLLAASCRLCLLTLIVWGVIRLFRIRTAIARHCLWLVPLLSVALLPLFAMLPHISVPILSELPRNASTPLLRANANTENTSAQTESVTKSFPTPEVSVSDCKPPLDNPHSRVQDGLEAVLLESEAAPVAIASRPLEAKRGLPERSGYNASTAPTAQEDSSIASLLSQANLLRITFVAWLLGLSLMLFRLVKGWAEVILLVKDAEVIGNGREFQAFCSLRERMGIGRNVQLLRSSLAAVPVALGVFRPKVILPRGQHDSFAISDMRMVMIHELAHVKRGDYIIGILQKFVQVVLFFNPLIYFVNRCLDLEREQTCDDWVLSLISDRSAYAECLAKTIGNSLSRPLASHVGMTALTGPKKIFRRIDMILDDERAISTKMSWKAMLTMILVTCLLLPIIGIVGIGRKSIAQEKTPGDKGAIIGVVRSLRSGRPVKGAIVEAFPQYVTPESESFFSLSIKTQADGAFTLTDCPTSERIAVTVRSPGHARSVYTDVTVRAGATTSVGNLFLQKGKRFTGKVTKRDGSPIGGVSVYACAKVARDGAEGDIVYNPLITETKDDGRFRFAHLADGSYLFVVLARGYAVETREARIGAYQDPAPIKLTLMKAKRIKGSVKTKKDKPIAEAEIILRHPEAKDNDLPRYVQSVISSLLSTKTEADGRYIIDHLKNPTCTLIARGKGFAPKIREGVDPGSKVNFVLTPGGSVSGRITNKRDDSPAPKVVIRASSGKGSGGWGTSVVTDKDGRYKIEHMTPGEFTLFVDAKEMIVTGETKVKVREGKEAKGHNFQLSPGARLTGVVLDRDTKQPIAEANIKASSGGGYFTRAATTGLDGRFEIKGLPPGKFNVFAGAEGCVRRETRFSTSDNLSFITALVVTEVHELDPLEILLTPGGAINGVLTDMNGIPVSGADVVVREAGRYSRPQARSNKKSNEKGEYVIHGVKPGKKYRVLATHPDFAYAKSDPFEVQKGETVTVNILLMRGGSVSGSVVDEEGNPLKKAKVKAHAKGSRNLEVGFKSIVRQTLADADGFYRIEHILTGPATLTADIKGLKLGVLKEAQISEGIETMNMDFRLTKGAFISGRIANEEGAPVEGASVRATSYYMNAADMAFRNITKSDGDGKYKLEGLDNIPFNVYVRHEDYGAAKKLSVQPNSPNVGFVLEKIGAIAGELVGDVTGEPITRFTIRLYAKKDGPFMMTTRPDRTERFASDAGEFEIDRVKSGIYSVEVTAKGYAPARKDRITVAAGKTAKNVRIKMRQGGHISGYVLRSGDNSPVEGAKIINGEPTIFSHPQLFYGHSSEDDEIPMTAADGSYLLEDLDVGEHTITAFHPDFAMNSVKEIEVVQGETTADVVIHLSQGGAIAGTVYDKAGRPQFGASVVASNIGSRTAKQAQTDEAGEYIIRGLVPGRYLLVKSSTPGQTDKQVYANAKEGETTVVNFGEAQGCRLYGRVLRSGKPVPGATICFLYTPQEGEQSSSGIESAASDEEGNYEISGLQVGKYRVLTYQPGNTRSFASLIVEVPDAAEVQHDIIIPESGIAGTVYGAATGEPLEDASVTVQLSDGEVITPTSIGIYTSSMSTRGGTTTTDEQGKYEMSGLNPGWCKVRATKAGYGGNVLENVEIHEGRITSGVDFQLPSGGAIKGAITDAKGKAISFALVYVYQMDLASSIPLHISTNRDGGYIIPGLAQGSYNVKLWTADYAPVTKTDVEVEVGEETELNVTLTPGGTLEATVLDADGNAVEGVVLDIVYLPPDGSARQYYIPSGERESDEEGRVQIRHISPGEYTVSALVKKEVKASQKVSIAEGETAYVEIKLPGEVE